VSAESEVTTDEVTTDPVEVIQQMLERTSALDRDGVAALFDDNIRFEHMFMPDGEPMIITSGEELARSLTDTLRRFDSWHIWMTQAYRLVGDPSTVISEWASEGTLKNGHEYRNRYIGIHKVVNGRIVFWREYAHPSPMELVWPDDSHRPDI
jgi:ketosteroid isomerase-like protein